MKTSIPIMNKEANKNLLVQTIFKNDFNLFSDKEKSNLIDDISKNAKDKKTIRCLIRNRSYLLKREEIVRQLWLRRLVNQMQYEVNRIKVEHTVVFGTDTSKRADIVILDRDRPDAIYAVIEVKKPKKVDGKAQLRSYCNGTGAPLAMWSNGLEAEVWNRKDPNHFISIHSFPRADQFIDDVIGEQWTTQTLINKENERVNAGISANSLRDLIVDMENEVLANAGVDVFEEVFKLIFTKLYDELESYRNKSALRFRNSNTARELYQTISKLFDNAKENWEGVFAIDDVINLSPEHLQICVGTLEEWKLFNSDLTIIDDAFEYLVQKSAKAEKGQFFTPRWIIEMCVRMLDPKEHESVIDTACGSTGFTMYSMFHVWRQIIQKDSNLFTMDEKPKSCIDYVQNKVFGIDFDERVVRVARCMNLIAGDGESNVIWLNSLDWINWKETENQTKWRDVYGSAMARFRKHRLNKKSDEMRLFGFDIVMANPPFAGKIKQTRLLSHYDTAYTKDRKLKKSVARDVLFVERNIDFLKPGGRMAIVLPEGRLNNVSEDKAFRNFMMEKCRVLAVISLHPNTFKPHTGIKTSVLFLQKWNDNPQIGPLCPKVKDYKIFFASQEIESVNNKGERVYVIDSNGLPMRNRHGHFIVSHDLYSTEEFSSDGIAEEFSRFAYSQGLSFASYSGYRQSIDFVNKCSIVNLKDVAIAERLDAKYFDSTVPILINSVCQKANRIRKVGDIATFNRRGVQPAYVRDGEVDVITSSHILDGRLDYENFKKTSLSFWEQNPDARVQDGDILTYVTGANIGRTAIYRGGGGKQLQVIMLIFFVSEVRILNL